MTIGSIQLRNTTSKSLKNDNAFGYTYSGTSSVTTSGGYVFLSLTGSGTLTITGSPRQVSILVVGGGGAGGCISTNGGQGGGGAGGGYVTTLTWLGPGTYSATIGAGGVGNTNSNVNMMGSPSAFAGILAIGGGSGGSYASTALSFAEGSSTGTVATAPGTWGGSGGGGGQTTSGVSTNGQAVASNRIVTQQGFTPLTSNNPSYGGNGGAGSGGNIGTASNNLNGAANGANAGNGGNGVAWFDGNNYAGGGGGSCHENATLNPTSTPTAAGKGGLGGGGNGAWSTTPTTPHNNVPTAGTANTGGGGGGGGGNFTNGGGKNGGSGIVALRWLR